MKPLLMSAALLVFCLLGLLRFELVTDPVKLWVGAGSQAAEDKDR